MSKDTLDNGADAVKKVVDDTKDALHEGQHRAAADGERARREVAGDSMTASEKVGSVVNEAKNRIEAEVDAAKRKVRDHT